MTPYSKDGTAEGSDISSVITIDSSGIESMFTDVDVSPVSGGGNENDEFMPGI